MYTRASTHTRTHTRTHTCTRYKEIHATYQHILYVNIETCNHNYIIILIVIYDHYFTITLVYGRIACSTYNSDSVNERCSNLAGNSPVLRKKRKNRSSQLSSVFSRGREKQFTIDRLELKRRDGNSSSKSRILRLGELYSYICTISIESRRKGVGGERTRTRRVARVDGNEQPKHY